MLWYIICFQGVHMQTEIYTIQNKDSYIEYVMPEHHRIFIDIGNETSLYIINKYVNELKEYFKENKLEKIYYIACNRKNYKRVDHFPDGYQVHYVGTKNLSPSEAYERILNYRSQNLLIQQIAAANNNLYDRY